MNSYRAKITENGRIVIPAPCRTQLNLKPGQEIIIEIHHNELRLKSLKESLIKTQEIIRKRVKNKSLLNELKKLRKEEHED